MTGSAGPWLGIGFLGLALAVTAGAFGAHALAERLDSRSLDLWETAARYLAYGSVALALAGLAGGVWPRAHWDRPAALLLVGTLVFAGTVTGLSLGGPRWLGAVTPIGGTLMIVGLAWLAWVACRQG